MAEATGKCQGMEKHLRVLSGLVCVAFFVLRTFGDGTSQRRAVGDTPPTVLP